MEIEGIIPAPYMARNHWVAMIEMDALRQPEIKELIQTSYQLVFEKLPKKKQAELRAALRPQNPEKLNRGRLRNGRSNPLNRLAR